MSFEFSEMGWPALNRGGQRIWKNENSLHAAGTHILLDSALGILPLDPSFFFHHLVPHVGQHIWHIENSIAVDYFSCYAIFTWIWTYKNSWSHWLSTVINLPLVVFNWESLSCEVIYKSQGDLNSSNSKYFPLRPPWSISVARLFFEVSISIFCVLIK